MTDRLAWGILGAGNIAKAFARGVQQSQRGRLLAVGSRSIEKANAFADQFDIPHRHGSYDDLLADPQVQAVYIATPHPQHAQWTIRAAEAGRHVLCEKPIGLNHAEAMAMVEAAREHGVFLMEAFMYRCHPQTHKLVELIREGAIGPVRMIEASFGFRGGDNPESRLMNKDLGGGGILDVGCYPVSAARLIAGAALGMDFAEPIEVKTAGHLGMTGIDEYAAATLKFPNDIIAQVATGVRLNLENVVRIHGDEGRITVPSPWIVAREGGTSQILVQRGRDTQTIEITTDQPLYGIEADTVAAALPKQQAPSPAMNWNDTLGNMHVLDQWRTGLGLTYPQETPAGFPSPLHGRGLKVRDSHRMKYLNVPDVPLPASRFVMGCDNQRTFAHAAVMFDAFFEQGGNTFDTAHGYGRGLMEQLLGQWIKTRNVRDEVNIIGKGAHTPDNFPDRIRPQLEITLDRLQTDHVDLYLLHRDNPRIPAGEFVDVLDELRREGRIRVFGGSNWSIQRVAEANDHARKHGRTPFKLLSNNFSLARMVDPVWDDCVAASDPQSRAFLTRTQIVEVAWSSQARGFFTDRAGRDKTDDAELVRCWYSDDNFQRRDRAIELARKKNCSPINIAGAYVLHQPFPTLALIGPRTLHELTTSLPTLDVTLTADEMKWLNLEA